MSTDNVVENVVVTPVVEAAKKRGRKPDPAIAALKAQLAAEIAERKRIRAIEKELKKAAIAKRKEERIAKRLAGPSPEEIEAKRKAKEEKAALKEAKKVAKAEARIKQLEEKQAVRDAIAAAKQAVIGAKANLKAVIAAHKKTRGPRKPKTIEVVATKVAKTKALPPKKKISAKKES